MKKMHIRSTHAAWIAAAMIASFSPQLFAAGSTWNTNDGTWSTSPDDAGNWDPATPVDSLGVTGDANFAVTTNSPDAEVDVDVTGTVYARLLKVGPGKTVTLNLADGASITNTLFTGNRTWSIYVEGATLGTGSGSAHLTIAGPATGTASVALSNFTIGASPSPTPVGGNTLTLSGAGLSVTADGATTVVGRYSNDNMITVSSKAAATLYGLWLSNTDGKNGNQVVVDDATLTINGTGSNNGLIIGTSGGATDYDHSLHHNSVTVKNGGTLTLSAGSTAIGGVVNAHLNSIQVTSGTFLNTSGAGTTIGNSAGTNLGGNAINIVGGTFQTNGLLTIYDYNKADENNEGANRLVVGNGGTFKTSTTVNSNGLIRIDSGGTFNSSTTVNLNTNGLLQLSTGATLAGKTVGGVDDDLFVNVNDGARFEAAGSGLAFNVKTTVASGGAFAVGLDGDTSASTLSLNSALTLEDGSIFEVSIFNSEEMGNITLGGNASLTIGTGAIFSLVLDDGYTPVGGDTWTLFGGDLSKITGEFDLSLAYLPTLEDGLLWELGSNGSTWQLAVVPEPGSVVLLGVAGVAGLLLRRRHKLG